MRESPDEDMVSWSRDWGQLLRNARQVSGMSLAQVSVRTGLSRGYLSKLESGQEGARNPSRATLVALARALPSFRALAYQLEPLERAQHHVSFAQREDSLAPIHPLVTPSAEVNGEAITAEARRDAPIHLGWRELEVLVAFLALERSAIPVPITARLIARVTDRTLDATEMTLARLAESAALRARPPARPGDLPTYGRGAAFEERLGLVKLGDALVLAAALLAQAAPAPSARGWGDEDL
jgi:transcriptional regulator with XRE-family HTH domain